MLGCRSAAGRLFQILGPATEKLLSPSRVCSRNSESVGVGGAKLGASGVRDQLAVVDQVRCTMELDFAATCRLEWLACSRPAASPAASEGYEELMRCGCVG